MVIHTCDTVEWWGSFLDVGSSICDDGCSRDDGSGSIRDDAGSELVMGRSPDPARDISRAGGPDAVFPNIGWSGGWALISCDLPGSTVFVDSVVVNLK